MAKVVVEFDAQTAGAIRDVDKLKRSVSGVGDGIGDGFDSSLGGAESKIKGFGGRMKESAKSIGAGFLGGLLAGGIQQVGTVVVEQLQASLDAASNLNETLSKTGQVFGPGADKIVTWSLDSAKAMGMSQRAALDAASQFAVLGKAGGLSGTDLEQFSTSLTTTAADMASFANTSPDEAITALAAGLRGESEPLRKYGILLDDATLRAQALKMGLISTTKDALTPQQKVLASQAVIMQQVGDAAGDFQRTADGTANSQRILSAEVENAQAALGQKLLPAFNWVLQAMIKVVDFIMSNVIPAFGATIDQVGQVAEWLVNAWNTAFNWTTTTWNKITSAISNAVNTVKGYISGFTSWVSSAWNSVTSALTSPFESAANIIRDIINRLKGVWNSVASTISGVGFSVSVPDWVPQYGGQSWDFRVPNLPRLAAGGYVTRPTVALVGERGPEIVAPEAMLRRILAEAKTDQIVNVTVLVDGTELRSQARVEATGVLSGQSRRVAQRVRYA